MVGTISGKMLNPSKQTNDVTPGTHSKATKPCLSSL